VEKVHAERPRYEDIRLPNLFGRQTMKSSSRHGLFALFSLILFVLMAEPIQRLIAFAFDFSNSHASQIILVPFISAFLMYWNRGNVFRELQSSPIWASLVGTLGLGLYAAARYFTVRLSPSDSLSLMIGAMTALWMGAYLLAYGIGSFKTALFPLLLLLFCIPIPSPLLERVIKVLQEGSATMTYALVSLTGTPITKDGVVLTLPDLVLEVAPQCSGIRSGISLIISALVAGHLLLRSPWSKGVLLVAVVPVLIIKNAIRIATLALLAIHLDPAILSSRLHQEGGILFFLIALIFVYPVLIILQKIEQNHPSSTRFKVPSMPENTPLLSYRREVRNSDRC
jgi:exosortase